MIDNSTKIQEGNEKKKLLKAQIKVLQDQLEKIKDIQIPRLIYFPFSFYNVI